MTNETQKRIEYFANALPQMRERVIATVIMLAIAMLTAVTATYAWVTLSRAPEVSSIATTLSSNGTLEIALADGTAQPLESDIDESIPTSDMPPVTESNKRWGNLINISDPSYGIDDLTLRPAQLNRASLGSSPLWGAIYGGDGRITGQDSKYTYAMWDGSEFLASTGRGVRAIASYYTATSSESAREYDVKLENLLGVHNEVNEFYKNSVVSRQNINGLGSVMSTYMQSKLNEMGYGPDGGTANIALTTVQVQAVRDVYRALYQGMEKEADALVALANLQQYIYAAEHLDGVYTEVNWEQLRTGKETYDKAGSKHKNAPTTALEAISLTNLKTFITDMTTASADIAALETLVDKSNSGETVYSNDIGSAVNHLCQPNSALIDGKTLSQWTAEKKSELLSLTSGHHLVTLCAGILKNYEQIAIDGSYRLPADSSTSTTSNAASISARAQYSFFPLNINITGHLCTSAQGSSNYAEDFGTLPSDINTGEKIAEDTYGMAVDFWIRTNSEGTYLTLEGATTVDTDGTILSYDGINRVWGATGNTALTTNSTTQGGGSCYTYYADTPEDMSRSLELLKSMKVAFVASDGTLLAIADMDTEHYYAVNGRITVPLTISQKDSVRYTPTDVDGQEITGYAIKYITTDEAAAITAIVYLDGTTLYNTDVLAAADIDGQLNIQFGSSENLQTIGSNDLLTAERYVTASLSESEFNFDTDNAPTTTVTVNVEGTNPETVKAFFVRAVNATQGTRQGEMTFTKRTEDTPQGVKTWWEADYTFTAPGTYYLRHVRLDGVDYALADPLVANVEGFAVTSVTWGEADKEATIYSADSSYTETVAVSFASHDVNRMPSTVQAIFVRDDGNVVAINTRYNAETNQWTGTGNFLASGHYTLSYLVMNGNYTDISDFAKKLTLYLGLTTAVYNNNSSLTDEFDTDQPEKVRDKNVQVKIYDNAHNELRGLEQTRLYYSLGSSATNGKDTNLTWNETSGYYEGTLPLVNPGRYVFSKLEVGENSLTRATESPIYVIASPNPPTYDASSKSTYHDRVQFTPLKTNAYLGPIKISDSASAQIKAVIYNDKCNTYFEIPMTLSTTTPGTMYYVNSDGGYWMVNLPSYLKTGGEYIVDGTWSVVCISVYDCYDDATPLPVYRDEENPLVWVGTSDKAQQYAAQHDLTASATLDFTKLSTTVSSTVNVEMTPGTTALGSAAADFMTEYKVADLGMYVTVKDDDGRVIPADKISEVKLEVSYSGNTDIAAYGYEVSGYNPTYPIIMQLDAASGQWKPDGSSNYVWQYVGKYTVTGLTVTVTGTQKTIAAGEHGVPAMYTITSKAPSGDNLTVKTLTQNQTVFGKTGDNVTGAFLAAYNPNVTVAFSLTPTDHDGKQYARVPGVSVELAMVYQDGATAPNGGYTWTGTTGYEQYNINMNLGTNNTYSASAQTLLAGRYSLSGTLHWTENGTAKTKSIGALQDMQVYSVRPTITVTGVSPAGSVTVNANGNGDQSYLVANASTFTAANRYGSNYAVAYMQYEAYTEENNVAITGDYTRTTFSTYYAHYITPIVTLNAANTGEKSTVLNIANNGSGSAVTFSGDSSQTVTIGRVENNSQTHSEVTSSFLGMSLSDDFKYKADNAYILGTQIIDSVTSTVGSATYTRALSGSITLSQTNQQAPKLTYTEPDGMLIAVQQTQGGLGIDSGSMVDGLTGLTITVTAQEGYYNPRLTQPVGAFDWTVVSEGTTESVYTCGMALGDMTMTGTAAAYPRITFSSSSAAAMAVTADGKALTSGVGVKPGTLVTVTLTANKVGGYCKPRLAAAANWTKTEGDYESTYIFAMPNAAVNVPAPTGSAMYQVNWVNTSALTFTAVDSTEQNKTVSAGGYVIPGHTIIITLTADGGTNPQLTSPSFAASYGSTANAFIRQYSFTMPSAAVALAGKADPYPTLQYGNDYAAVGLTSNGASVSTEGATEKGIKPGNTVIIVLSAKAGYRAPRMTQPAGVTNWSANDGSSTYSFTMPNAAVDVSTGITASGCTVMYDANGGSVNPASATYAGAALTLPTPAKGGYKFTGWYTAAVGGAKVSGAYTPLADVTLYAQWEPCRVTYNANGGSVNPTSATYAGSAMTLPTPTRTSYKFNGWYTAISGGTKVTSPYTPSAGADVTLYAQWTGYTVTFNANGGSVSPASATYAGTPITPPTNATRSGYEFQGWYSSASGGTKYSTVTPTSDMTIYAQWKKAASCVASGTMVTMADGTQKPVEALTLSDTVLAFNHETGQLVPAAINFIEADGENDYNVIYLEFSDGTVSRIIYEHGFFDLDLMKYVYIHEEDCTAYIGHRFYTSGYDGKTQTAGEVTLVDAYVVNEYTGCFSFTTVYDLNMVTDGLLSMPGGITGMFNFFDFDADLKYNEAAMQADIETYGLMTYDDFKGYISYDTYLKYPAPYISVSLGKGLMTEEDLQYLIARYAVQYEDSTEVQSQQPVMFAAPASEQTWYGAWSSLQDLLER